MTCKIVEICFLEIDMDVMIFLLLIVLTAVVGLVIANLLARDVVNARINLLGIYVVISEDHTRENLQYEE